MQRAEPEKLLENICAVTQRRAMTAAGALHCAGFFASSQSAITQSEKSFADR